MTLETIRTDARYTVSPQLTSAEYSDTDLDRNANQWYKKAVGWAIGSGDDWQIAGETLFRDFKTNVSVYALPMELIRVLKGEVLYSTGGSFVPLNFYDISRNQGSVEGNDTRTFDDPTNPTAELLGNDIIIRPAQTTGADIVNGIMLNVQMSLTDMATSSSVPQLIETVQRIVSKGAAFDYCMAEEMWNKARELKYEIFGDPRVKDDIGLVGELKALYSIRSAAYRDQISPRRRSYK